MSKKKLILIIIMTAILSIMITSIVSYLIYRNQLSIEKNTVSTIENNQNDSNNPLGNENKISFDWLEDSGEAEALEYEAYNSATNYLSQIAKEPSSKPKAVILDLDETCLNNAAFQGYEIENNNGIFNYNTWTQWVNFAEAPAIPGSVAFTQAAEKAGIEVFYVSGRSQSQLDATVKNLKKDGFADANNAHVFLYPSTQNGKQPTFDQIEEKYNVEMFVGDQLTDMGSAFQNKTNAEEKQIVTKDEKLWGTKYITIPDPLYGNYLNAIYGYKANTVQQDVNDINSGIESFNPKTGKTFYC
ncbi:MAG: 5'-nucleotidase, lipoprotein e(P4) family [Sarcina sp.]